MRALKKILMSLGAVFALVIIAAVWLGILASSFKTEQTPFIHHFVADLSRQWIIHDVYDRLDNAVIEQASTPQGEQLMRRFRSLGALRSTGDLEMRNYNVGPFGATGAFSMKAYFENGEAVLDITLNRHNGAVRVVGFYMHGIKEHQQVREKTATVRVFPSQLPQAA
jgi:hypothetical protein